MGRKRKAGPREPNGRIVRAGRAPAPPPVALARIRAGLIKAANDPALGTVYGIMYLQGEITPEQYGAATTLDAARAAYQRAIDARPLRSASLEPAGKAAEADPLSEAGQVAVARDMAAVDRYRRFVRLLVEEGADVARATWALVEGVSTWEEREIAKRGLARVGRWMRTGK